MSLPSQSIPISFFKGINTKSDDKNSIPGDLLVCENGVFTKTGKISKRNGFTSLSRSAINGNVASGLALSSYNDELVLFTGRDVLGYSVTEQEWINRGVDYSLESNLRSIVNNNSKQQNPEMKNAFGLEVYAWEDSNNGVKYSVVDANNQSVLVANGLVDTFGFRPKVVVWNGKIWILYSTNNIIFARSIDPAAPFIISDPNALITDLNTFSPQFDALVVTTSGDEPVETVIIGYSQLTSGDNTAGLAYVFDIGDVTIYSYNHDATNSVGLFTSGGNALWFIVAGANQFWVAGVRDFIGTTELNTGFVVKTGTFRRCMGYENTQSGLINLIYENDQDVGNFGFGDVIFKSSVSINSLIFNTNIFMRGVGLYSKFFTFNNNYFFVVSTNSELQATYILVNEFGQIVDRTNINNGGGNKNNSNDGFRVGVCTDTVNPNNGIFQIPFQFKTSIESNGGTTFLPTGINVDEFNFNATNVFSNVFTSGNLNVCGGVFKNYDGVNYVENNFLQYPEGFFCDGSVFNITITIPGAFGIAQSADINTFAGYRIASGAYFTFDSIGQHYYLWFRVDGVGIDPSPGGAGVVVDINSSDTPNTVGIKIAKAFPKSDFDAFSDESSIFVTNKITGSVPIPTVGTMNFGNITAGTRLYNVIYSWVDNNGIIQRSSTAIPVSTTISATGNISIIVPTLRVTEKNDVRIDIYRTENLGSTIFYRVSPIDTGVANDKSVDWVSFIDTASDESILSNDLLYTTGGVLDNTAPPASTMVALYKNRVFINSEDDKNLLWFSKYVFEGIPVQFSEFLTFKCDPRGGEITALGVLDDKLIIFKETSMFVLVGNGPTDTGDSNDYDQGATLISTDIGCSEAKSVVVTPEGLMFKSHKGIYLLNRGLQTTYIGSYVEDFNHLTVTSAVLSPNNNQVRFTTSDGAMLVYDYFVQQWATFTGLEATDAHFVGDIYYLLKSNGIVYQEDQNIYTDNGNAIKLKLKTGWITLAGIQGFQRVVRVSFLGSYLGPHILKTSFAYDYGNSPKAFTQINATTLIGDNQPWGSEATWGKIGTVWGGSFIGYDFRIHLTYQKCEAIQIIIEDIQEDNFNQAYDISNIALEVKIKQGNKKLSTSQSFGNG